MTDSLTQSDIDRIYERLQEDVDISKIKSKSELYSSVKSFSKTRFWNRTLNNFFWDIHKSREDVLEAVPEIQQIPVPPTTSLNPIQKRKRTIKIKSQTISVNASDNQKAYTRRKGRKWENVEIEFAERLKKDGLTYEQISLQLERTKSSISTKLSRFRRRQ